MPLGSVLFAFVVGALICLVTGANPVDAYSGLLCGGIGIACAQGENSALQISNTIVFLTPLITTGVAVALPFRAGLFNIGAEGQLIAGAIACTAIGVKFSGLPSPILLPMVLLGGMAAGALWAGIAGVLKATVGAHEVVTTIMLNYVAQWLLRYLIIGGPLQLREGTSTSLPIGHGARLPTLLPSDNSLIIFGLPASVYRVHTGLLIALAAAAIFAFLLWRTSFGYEIRAVGQSQKAARYAGISVRRTIILTMLIAGAFAGLAGAIQVAGVDHNLTDMYFSDTTGFDAIAVALLGLGSAVGIVVASLLFGALHAGGSIMQSDAGISSNLVLVLQALILFSIAANFVGAIRRGLPFGRASAELPPELPPAAGLMSEAAVPPPEPT
ncbi:MAG: ABC transporter permease [Chloroflexi bacterium]|nr:MAG: ABC transporter permease [Chloroflexota bacterium]TMG58682.1 MAG: ABC transporter permease [Chloroflexota bacterium]